MTSVECVHFLQQTLPRIGLQWRGYRRVRSLVCKRIKRRIAELRLPDVAAYARHLETAPEEWNRLEAMARIPVSRFYRDRSVFDALERHVLPAIAAAALAERRRTLDCWSACCAGGEEAYSLALLWQARLAPSYPALALRVIATDVDAALLDRARAGCYGASSLKELPEDLLAAGLEHRRRDYCVRPALRNVLFVEEDVRGTGSGPLYDLVLCRNAVLTYFAPHAAEDVMRRVLARLRPGGALVIGMHEMLPQACAPGISAWPGAKAVYRKPADTGESALRCLAPHAEPVVAHGELTGAMPPVPS